MRYYDLDINGKVRGSYAVPQPNKELVLLKAAPDGESKWDGSAWVPDQEKIDARVAEENRIQAKAQAVIDNLPSLAEIEAAIEAASSIAALKVIIKKMARVLYWIAKDKAD